MREVRVIADDGSQLGIISTDDALRRAEEKGLDLVEVQPMARPPVCKIMDYGKFKYEQKRKAAEMKKKQKVIEVKEVKFRPKTGIHDFDTKVRHLREFLLEGDKGKITIMFRGREIVHPEIGQDVLKRVVEAISDIAMVELSPRMEGRSMFMIVAPGKAGSRPKPMMPMAHAPNLTPAQILAAQANTPAKPATVTPATDAPATVAPATVAPATVAPATVATVATVAPATVRPTTLPPMVRPTTPPPTVAAAARPAPPLGTKAATRPEHKKP